MRQAASLHRACGVALLVEADADAEKAMASLLDCFHPRRILLLPGVKASSEACSSAVTALEDASHNACAWVRCRPLFPSRSSSTQRRWVAGP